MGESKREGPVDPINGDQGLQGVQVQCIGVQLIWGKTELLSSTCTDVMKTSNARTLQHCTKGLDYNLQWAQDRLLQAAHVIIHLLFSCNQLVESGKEPNEGQGASKYMTLCDRPT